MKLFEKFIGSTIRKEAVEPYRLYVRDGKPAALQGWFYSEAVVTKLGNSLSDSGLTWIWESTRTGPPITVSEDEASPEHRSRTFVENSVLPMLREDLLERNLHGFRRFVALYGGSDEIEGLTDDDDLRRELEAFANGKKSIVSVLLVQMGDVAADIIYFNLENNDYATTLLAAFGVPPLSEIQRSQYREMNGEELETVMGYLSCAEHDH